MTRKQRQIVVPAVIAGAGISITLGMILIAMPLMFVLDADSYVALILLGLILTWPLLDLVRNVGRMVGERRAAR